MKDTISFHLMILYRDFLAYTTKELKEQGVSFGQMPFVLYTGKHPGCTQADLTRVLNLDWGYSQRSVTKLADSGFLQRTYDPRKGCNCLTLTQRGEQVFAASHEVFSAWDQLRTDCLSEEETKTLMTLLRKLTADNTESE